MEHRFEIVPYEGAGPIRFRSSQHEVETILGTPDSFYRTDYLPQLQLDSIYEANYPSLNVNIAYTLDYTLNYVCFTQHRTPFPGSVTYKGINIFDDKHAFDRLLDHDSEPFEWVGFIFLMQLGLRLEGFHCDSEDGLIVSLFERGRYDRKLPKFTPYKG